MASLSGPDSRLAVPSARYLAATGTVVDTSQGMFQQPESTMPSLAASSLPGGKPGEPKPAAEAGSAPPPQRIPRWLERLELFLRVMLRMYLGLAVCYAPWSRTFWDQNPVFAQFPTLSNIAANGAVKGLVSGLGLLNLWIALHDAMRYRDR